MENTYRIDDNHIYIFDNGWYVLYYPIECEGQLKE
jgi:hypothetical protein